MKTNYDKDLYKIKALEINTKNIVCGWFFWDMGAFINIENQETTIQININSICRNTGVKISNQYLYEFDLVLISKNGNKEMGVVIWDEYNKGYCIQKNANYSGRTKLRENNIINIIGNVVLNDKDNKIFKDYSDSEDEKYIGLQPCIECRSKQHLNKLSKQHLPKL